MAMGAVSSPVRMLDRYVAAEFVAPFAATAAGFMVLLLASTIFELTDLMVVRRLAAATTLQLLALKLPETLSIALPIASLFGSLMGAGRLVRDGEMTVMRVSGLSVLRVAMPVVVMGALVSAGAFALSEYVVPAANHRYQLLVRQVLQADPVPIISENVFFRGTPRHWFYVGRVNRSTRELQDILVYELQPNGFPTIYTAKRGTYDGRRWRLDGVIMKQLDQDGYVTVESSMASWEMVLAEPTEAYLGSQKSPAEMNRRELGGEIARLRRAGVVARSLLVDYHIKLSLPLSCLVFAVLAVPLSLRGGRGGRSFAVASSLGLALLYYILFSLARALGNSGGLEPLAAAWLPNLLFLTAGLLLFYRAEWAS